MMKKRSLKKAVILIRTIILVAGLLVGYYFLFLNPQRGTVKSLEASQELDAVLSRQQTEEDLKFLVSHLKSRHPAWLDGSENLTQAVMDQYQIELNRLGETTTVLDIWQAAGRIMAELHDGHTWVNWKNSGPTLYIDDFTQIRAYGYPISINGVPTDEVLTQYLSQSSYELAFYAEERFYQHALVTEDMLRWAGVDTEDGVDMDFLTEDGEMTFHYTFVPHQRAVGHWMSCPTQTRTGFIIRWIRRMM